MLGSNFVAQIVLEPSDSICAAKALFNPWMIETMKITVTTPTLTPRMVSADRSLLLRTVSSAIKADSRMSMKFIMICHRDTKAQRHTNRKATVCFLFYGLRFSVPLWLILL